MIPLLRICWAFDLFGFDSCSVLIPLLRFGFDSSFEDLLGFGFDLFGFDSCLIPLLRFVQFRFLFEDLFGIDSCFVLIPLQF